MKKHLYIFAFICLASAPLLEAKIAPYLKLARGVSSAAGALYFGSSAYSWHKKAEAAEPHNAQSTYAQGRCYASALIALVLGISAFLAIERSLEQLDK